MKAVFKICLFTIVCFSITSFKNINSFSSDYKLSKSIEIKTKSGNYDATIVLSKNTRYKFTITEKSGNITAKIIDSNKRLLATNKDIRTNKVYDSFIYICRATGAYKIKFEMQKSGTGVCSVGFVAM